MPQETANREQVGRALDLARDGLRPFVERHLRRTRGGIDQIPALLRDTPYEEKPDPLSDIAVIVIVVRAAWDALRSEIKRSIRSEFRNGVEEVKGVRDAWAHQESFSDENTERALDTVRRLLRTIGAKETERQQAQRMWEEYRARESSSAAVAEPPVEPPPAEPEPAPPPVPEMAEVPPRDEDAFRHAATQQIERLRQQIAEKHAERERLKVRTAHLEADRERIAREIAGVAAERESVDADIQQIEDELRRVEHAIAPPVPPVDESGVTSVAEPEEPEAPVPEPRGGGRGRAGRSETSQASADLVYEILAEAGRPLHYRDIYRRYEQVRHRDPKPPRSRSGNPANALATRYRPDPRFENVGRGMYALRGAELAPSPAPAPSRQRPRTRRSGTRYTSARPAAYTLFGVRHEVQTFRDVLLGVCATLHERSPAEFERVLELRGHARPHFSRTPDDMHTPAQVARSGIFVETKLSAIRIVERCRQVIELCGFNPREFDVETRS